MIDVQRPVCGRVMDHSGLSSQQKEVLMIEWEGVDRAYRADCRDLSFIPDGLIACAVTSTPYWRKRQYSADPDEFGQGTLNEFIADQVKLGEAIKSKLRDDGLYWLNLGDTMAGSGGAGGDHNSGGSKGPESGAGGIGHYRGSGTDSSIPGPQASLVPWRVALAMQDAGWLVRSPIIWNKEQIKPEDPKHVRRPRFQYEVILMLAKTRTHRYFHERECEAGDVWTFPPRRGPRKGVAPFPADLPTRCISVSTEPGDVVLDPCAGANNTTAWAAYELQRHWVAVDLYEDPQ